MTVIRPNSVSGINSITAQADEIKVFKSNGTQGGLIIGGANLNATTGISTILALNVTGNVSIAGTLTYQDVTNVDSLGIGTFRTGINVSAGQLDVGSNIKLGNAGVITATSFSGSGANLTGIDTDLVSDTSPQLGGDLASNNHDILFADNDKAIFGTGSDFKIYHNGTDNYIMASNGHIRFDTGSAELVRITSSGQMGIGDNSPDRELVVKNASSNSAIKIEASNAHTSQLFFSDTDAENVARISLFHGSGQSTSNALVIDTGGSPRMTIQSDGKIGIGRVDPVNFVDIARGQDEENILLVRGADNTTEYGAMGIHSGNCVITGGGAGSTNTGIMFRTAASGNETNRLLITSAGNVEPATDDTYNFGSLTKRWANIYTADLNLSNEGKTNDIDGTWGQYTIQEGEDNLYLINKRSGKKYKFLLQEVS